MLKEEFRIPQLQTMTNNKKTLRNNYNYKVIWKSHIYKDTEKKITTFD